jgi:hypothetical protein
MTTRIIYDQATNTSKMLAQAVHKIIDARHDALRVKAILDNAQSGVPADWPALAAELGLVDKPGYTKEQQAQDVWTIFSTAMDHVDHAAVRELSRLDQG